MYQRSEELRDQEGDKGGPRYLEFGHQRFIEPNTCMFSLRTSLVSYTTLHLMPLLSPLTTYTIEQLRTFYTQTHFSLLQHIIPKNLAGLLSTTTLQAIQPHYNLPA